MYKLTYTDTKGDHKVVYLKAGKSPIVDNAIDIILLEVGHTDTSFKIEDSDGNIIMTDETLEEY